MQRDQHAWLLSQLHPLDASTWDRANRLYPDLRRRISRRHSRECPDAVEERISYGVLQLLLSLQRNPGRSDAQHMSAAMYGSGAYIRDDARAWGVNEYQLRRHRRRDWHPADLTDAVVGRRIEDCEAPE